MGKYLELFRGEVGDLIEKTKLENKPYVAYSTKLGKVVYTVVPAKDPVVEGPADNEIWYTSTDGSVINPSNTSAFGVNIASNTYENDKGVITFDGNITNIGDYAFSHCESLTSITIPNSATSIGALAFYCCSSLISIVIGNSVTTIGYKTFEGCYALTSIVIPDSVTSINGGAFERCTSLATINIPNRVTKIEYNVFYDCDSLTSITIPNSVTSIGANAFQSCSFLTSITFEGTMGEWDTIEKAENWNNDCPEITVHCTDGDVVIPTA